MGSRPRAALIADYLLGQLPRRVAEQTRERLASVPSDRAWARGLAAALAPIAGRPLPEIPDPGRPPPSPSIGAPEAEPAPRSDGPSSRRGGAILLGVGALVVVAVVVVLIAGLGGGSSKPASRTAGPRVDAADPTTTSAATSTSAAASASPRAQIVAQTNLNPRHGGGSAKGVGFVVKDGSAYGIIIQAQHIPPNHHNAYAAWLYNSPSDAYRLGFVNPGVGETGQLQTGGVLPAAAGRFKQLLLTLETQANPQSPGAIVLEGRFSGVAAAG